MTTGNPKFSPDVKSPRRLLWDQARAEVDQIADPTGRGIDEGIKETIVALNVNGISTAASCEGHTDSEDFGQRPWPWVLVQAPNEPAERFEGELEAIRLAAAARKMTVSEFTHQEEYWEIVRQVSENPLTTEYQEWEKKNEELRQFVSRLLTEFYKDRKTKEDIRLKTSDEPYPHYGEFDLTSVTERGLIMSFLSKGLSDNERKELQEKLPARQQEMRDFADFLKRRFFSQAGEAHPSLLRGFEQREERNRRWADIRKKIEAIPDIDPGIIEAVTAFNAVGLKTDNSCEGHLDHGRNAPWITLKETEQREARALLEKFYEKRKVADNVKIVAEEVDEDIGYFFVHNGGRDFFYPLGSSHDKGTEDEYLSGIERDQEALGDEGLLALRVRLETYRAEFNAFAQYLEDLFLQGKL